jgi:6-phosphogluconolactonase
MLPLQTFQSRHALDAAAAERIAEALRAGVRATGEGCAALSGGTTPEPAYALLSAKNLDWPKLRFALVDERFVPPDHPHSNEAMLRRALRKPLERGARLTPMYAQTSLENAASAANAAYAGLRFDIAVMGMGLDGHTASWFPGSPQLGAALDAGGERTIIAVEAAQAAGSTQRLTMTLAAVARAERVLLLIAGAEKHAALLTALTEPAETSPLAALWTACAGKLDVLWAG